MDTAEKVSGPEMRNVGVAVASSAWMMASADEAMALHVAELVASAGRSRVAIERRDGSSMPDHAEALAAWRVWSADAVRSVARLVVTAPSPAFSSRLEMLATSIQ